VSDPLLYAVERRSFDPYAELGPPHDQDAARASWQVGEVTVVRRAGSDIVELHGPVEKSREMVEVALLKRCSELPMTVEESQCMGAALADLGFTASEIGGILFSCAIMAAGSVSKATLDHSFDVIDALYSDVSNELYDRGCRMDGEGVGQPLYLPPDIGETG